VCGRMDRQRLLGSTEKKGVQIIIGRGGEGRSSIFKKLISLFKLRARCTSKELVGGGRELKRCYSESRKRNGLWRRPGMKGFRVSWLRAKTQSVAQSRGGYHDLPGISGCKPGTCSRDHHTLGRNWKSGTFCTGEGRGTRELQASSSQEASQGAIGGKLTVAQGKRHLRQRKKGWGDLEKPPCGCSKEAGLSVRPKTGKRSRRKRNRRANRRSISIGDHGWRTTEEQKREGVILHVAVRHPEGDGPPNRVPSRWGTRTPGPPSFLGERESRLLGVVAEAAGVCRVIHSKSQGPVADPQKTAAYTKAQVGVKIPPRQFLPGNRGQGGALTP